MAVRMTSVIRTTTSAKMPMLNRVLLANRLLAVVAASPAAIITVGTYPMENAPNTAMIRYKSPAARA